MFTLQEIKAAHAKVKSGADFPAYVQEIKQLGLVYYAFMVPDGRTVYHHMDGSSVNGDPVYAEKMISKRPLPATLKQIIADHQQGKAIS